MKDANLLIETYLTRFLGFTKNEELSHFEGVVPAFESGRKGFVKWLYSVPIIIDYKVLNGKAVFVVIYSSVEKTTVICDKSQATTKEHYSPQELPKDLFRHLDYVGDDIVDHIRDFVNKDEEELPQWYIVPDFMLAPYIIDDGSVTFYSVLTSTSGLTKEQLYELAEKFFTFEYRSGKAVIEIRDPEKYIITGKGIYSNIHEEDDNLSYSVPHIFSVQCRDGRVRASITLSGIDVYGRFDKVYVGIVGNLPYGTEDIDGIKETVIEAEKIIVRQFRSLQKAIDEGLTSMDSLEDW